jgi:mRNA-degrading endonuclease toxin of MazEF toxin-antitoxin module
MPLEGQVYDLSVATTIGPWASGRHPGLVVSKGVAGDKDAPIVVVPLTSAKQKFTRLTHVELDGVYGSINGPMLVLCEYTIAIPASAFDGLTVRGVLPQDLRAKVKTKLGWYFSVPFAGQP